MSCEPMIVDGFLSRRLVLPLPPSVNGYWTRGTKRNGQPNMRRTDRAQSFLARALAAIRLQGSPSFGAHPVVVTIYLHCRKGATQGDVDNYNKGLLDACTHAGVWDDDAQVIDINPVRRGLVQGGGAVLVIRAATENEIENSKLVEPEIDKLRDWGLA